MKQFTVFHPLVLSFYSRSLYQDVARHWKGIGARYLLLILTIVWLPLMFALHHRIGLFIDHHAPAYVKQVPEITVKEGQVIINKTMPYKILDPSSGETLVLFDSDDSAEKFLQSKAILLITKNTIYTRTTDDQIHKMSLDSSTNLSMGQQRLNHLLQIAKDWLIVLIFPCVIFVSFVFRLLQALLYAAMGLVFSKLLKVQLSYQQCCRLAVVAVTPAVIIGTLSEVIGLHLPFSGVIMFLLAMAYLFFAIYSNSDLAMKDEF